MKVPFYKQEKDWNCGPACMRMVLEALGIKKSEDEMARLLGTDKLKWTRNRSFAEVAEKLKLNYTVRRNSTIKEMQKLHKDGWLIIIGYLLPKEAVGHHAVLKNIDKKNIYLLDPDLGPKTKYSISTFIKIWKNGASLDNEKRWFFGLRAR